MSQTTETPQPTNAELAEKVVGAVTAVQDAEAVLVEGAKKLAAHLADPNAHGTDVSACVAQAVADHDGNEGAHDGMFVKAGDARLTDARTPKPHKDSHKTGGTDALAPTDIGAAPASHTSATATASALGHVKLGKVAGTACEGNDARLSNARTPLGHKATHQTGGSDALAPDDIGAAPASHTGVAATASVLGHVTFGTAAGTACQGNDSRLANARTPTAHAATATTYGAASDTQYGHAKASGTTPKAAGTAAVGTETAAFARGDHVHPAQTTVSGNAGSATKLAASRTIDGVGFNGSANITHYGTCSTAAATAEKAVALSGFVLATGAAIRVKFTVTNTAASPTLNVNSTGAKPVYYRGAAVTAGTLAANRTYEFVYNGTQYELVGDIDSNTTYTAGSVAPKAAGTAAVGTSAKYAREDHVHPAQTTVSGNAGSATKLATARTIDGVSFNGSANITHYGSCSTEAATAAKVVACTGFALATGSRITVRFTVTNTAANPTLNVNNTGAKAIRYRNAAISAGYLAVNRTYDFVYDGTYYQLVGDVDSNTTYVPAAAAPKAAGTAAVGTSTKYAREDHVHPAQTTVSGNAGTATKLATARTVRTNLASTATASFDGSANITPGVTGVLPVANGGTGNTTNTAANATKWNGAAKTVSTANPSGGANGDIWFKY